MLHGIYVMYTVCTYLRMYAYTGLQSNQNRLSEIACKYLNIYQNGTNFCICTYTLGLSRIVDRDFCLEAKIPCSGMVYRDFAHTIAELRTTVLEWSSVTNFAILRLKLLANRRKNGPNLAKIQ